MALISLIIVQEHPMKNNEALIEKAKITLNNNDLGGYTVPTHGLYPFQWNWDSAITALGWLKFDEPRAWQEIELLLSGQWENGMIPHIIFHKESETYFPGPDVWGSHRKVKSTSISQPPVLASVIKIMFEECQNRTLVDEKLSEYLPKLLDYHLWWYRERDPQQTGLVASYHPWESGMDNSPAWDAPLAAVPCVDWEYHRRDLSHIDASERPHKEQYDRYLYLVEFFKLNKFDSEYIYQHCPYKVNDIGIIAILHRATKDLLAVCQELGIQNDATMELNQHLSRTQGAINELWCEEDKFFYNRDLITGQLCRVKTNASLMTLYGSLANEEQSKHLKTLTESWLGASPYSISSTHPDSELYEPQRYWRGPVWLHINWMIALGFEGYGFSEVSDELKDATESLILKSGYYEYFNSETGAGCGGNDFSWTAAIALHWLL
jgi:glycogen debranching enzyme